MCLIKGLKKVAKGIKTAWLFIDNRQKWRRAEDWLIYKICGLLFVAALFFAVCILIVFFKACGDWRISVGAEGIKNMQLFWQQHSSLLKAFFYTITLFVASHTLIKYIDVETCRSLGNIKNRFKNNPQIDMAYALRKFENYQNELKNEEQKVTPSTVESLDYLGLLELSALMLERGIITKDEFFDQFGYKYVDMDFSTVKELINKKPKQYEPLLSAIKVIEKRKKEIKKKEAKCHKQDKNTSADTVSG